MSRSEICPTCGVKLGPTAPRPETRVCSGCSRNNPAGFSYCGFCATPMENTEMGARMAGLAAPPGGWPSLTTELVEVRFYLQQGLFDDAYELLSIMQKRYPGHPQLTELARQPKPTRRIDTGVLALVDSVLADSANLVSKVPRRSATRFSAPAQGGAERTDVHTIVEPSADDEQTTTRGARSPSTGPQSPTRPSGSQPRTTAPPIPVQASTGSQRVARPVSGSQRATTGAKPAAQASRAAPQSPVEAASQRREPTRIYRTVEPPAGTRAAAQPVASAKRAAAVTREIVATPTPQSGHTVVVDALQMPAPFPETPTAARAGKSARKRGAPPAAQTPAPAVVAAPAAAPAEEAPRRRARFGEHVLNRLR